MAKTSNSIALLGICSIICGLLFRTFSEATFSEPGLRDRYMNVSVSQLLDPAPVAITTSTLINRQATLIPGMQYTISFWYWHWKTPHVPSDHEMAILSSRRSLPYVLSRGVASSALLPSIIFNGMLPERYFFSVSRDVYGHYSNGLWSKSNIRYHEWTHFAIAIDADRFSVYINGDLQGSRHFNPVNKSSEVYRRSMWEVFANNTLLQIGGGRGLLSTPGMVRDVILFENISLEVNEIRSIISDRPPPATPTLYKVMREMDLYSLSNFSVIDVKYTYYGEIEFGLCPYYVCGDVCIDESFYVGIESGAYSRQRILRSLAHDVEDDNAETGTPWVHVGERHDSDAGVRHHQSSSVPPSKHRTDYGSETSHRDLKPRGAASSMGHDGNIDMDSFEDGYIESYLDNYDSYYDDGYGIFADDEYKGAGEDGLNSAVGQASYLEKGLMSPELINVDFGDHGRNERIRRVLEKIDIRMVQEQEAMLREDLADPRVDDYLDPYDDTDLYAGVDVYEYGTGPTSGRDDYKMIEVEIEDLTEDDIVAIEDWAQGQEERRRARKEARRRLQSQKELKLEEMLHEAERNDPRTAVGDRNGGSATSFFDRKAYKAPSVLPKAIHWNSLILSKRRHVITAEEDEDVQTRKNIRIGGFPSSTMKHIDGDHIDSVIARLLARGNYEDVYKSLYPEVPLKQIRVQHLYESSILWANSRHDRFHEEAAWDIRVWETSNAERIESVLFLALWLADDIGPDKDTLEWSFHLPGSISHPIRLMLGFRTGLFLRDSQLFSKLVRLIDFDWKGKISTTENTDILRSFMGISDAGETTDLSLRSALGDLRFSEILAAVKRNESNLSPIVEDFEQRSASHLSISDSTEVVSVVVSSSGATAAAESAHVETDGSALASGPESVLELLPTPGKLTCEAAAAYYFPVSQYVSAHFGDVESGISRPEVVILSGGEHRIAMTRGEDAVVHDLNVADAEHGDANAQMWLAMRYFWGYAGVQPNLAAARRYIERAAAANHPEGLYNMGVFHENGMAGLPAAPEVALEYFTRAAEHPRPFNMALFALGNYYRYGKGGVVKNVTKAIEYFTRAALKGSQDAYFSLGSMARTTGDGYLPDMRLSLYFYSRAAAANHVRSISALAHALWDPESWLGESIRLREVQQRFPNVTILQSPLGMDATVEGVWNRTISLLKYNASEPILLSVNDFATYLPEPIDFSCPIALELMKMLSEHCLRAVDVTDAALTSYLLGYKWPSVDHYDEASDLGVAAAQENAGYIYESLVVAECGEPLQDPVYPIELSFWNITSSLGRNIVDIALNMMSNMTGARIFPREPSMEMPSSTSNQSARNSSRSQVPNLEGERCKLYYERMAAIRRLQRIGNFDAAAMRQVAKQLIQGAFPFDRNLTAGVIMYGLAAEIGDVQSLMALGWMVFRGEHGMTRNCSAALQIFSAAVKWEAMLRLDVFSSGTSGGLAPLIAWAHAHSVCAWESVKDTADSGSDVGRLLLRHVSLLVRRYEWHLVAGMVLLFVYVGFLFDLRRRSRALGVQ